MTIPRATYTNRGDVILSFPYNARLVGLLKAEIPSHGRSYDPADKTWTVAAAYAGFAANLMRRYFPDARFEQPSSPPEPDSIRTTDRALGVLHLLPSAPPELIEAAFRTLARLHHPDVGGDRMTMTRLNAAHALLRERLPA